MSRSFLSYFHSGRCLDLFPSLQTWPNDQTKSPQLYEKGNHLQRSKLYWKSHHCTSCIFFTNNLIMWFIKNTMSVCWNFWLIQDQDNLDHYAKWVWLIKLKILNQIMMKNLNKSGILYNQMLFSLEQGWK